MLSGFPSIEDSSWLCMRLEHPSIELLTKLLQHVHGLQKLNFEKDHFCDPYQMGKQIKHSFKPKNMITTFKSITIIAYGSLLPY